MVLKIGISWPLAVLLIPAGITTAWWKFSEGAPGSGRFGDSYGVVAAVVSICAVGVALDELRRQQADLDSTKQARKLRGQEVAFQRRVSEAEAALSQSRLKHARMRIHAALASGELIGGRREYRAEFLSKRIKHLGELLKECEGLLKEAPRTPSDGAVELPAPPSDDTGFSPPKLSSCGLFATFAILILMAMFWYFIVHVATNGHAGGAEFGDAFAPVTNLATSLALLVAIWASAVQRHEYRSDVLDIRQESRELRSNAKARLAAYIAAVAEIVCNVRDEVARLIATGPPGQMDLVSLGIESKRLLEVTNDRLGG